MVKVICVRLKPEIFTVKAQRKVMLDFPGNIVRIPPCDLLFVLWQNCFFRIFRKNVKFFFNEIDCKKFSKCFSMNSAVKNFEFFFNSLKLTIKNFRKKIRNFLLLNSLKKIWKIFHSQFHWKKNSTFFRKIGKKKIFLLQKKNGGIYVKINLRYL